MLVYFLQDGKYNYIKKYIKKSRFLKGNEKRKCEIIFLITIFLWDISRFVEKESEKHVCRVLA